MTAILYIICDTLYLAACTWFLLALVFPRSRAGHSLLWLGGVILSGGWRLWQAVKTIKTRL